MKHLPRTILICVIMQLPLQAVEAMGQLNGSELYQQHCQSCHGMDGSGDMANIPNLQLGEGMMQADFMLFDVMKRGKGIMPAYDGLMSDEEIETVITYTRTLQ